MNTLIILSLAILLVSATKKVVIGPPSPLDADKLYARLSFLKNANQAIAYTYDSTKQEYIIALRHNLANEKTLFNLEASAEIKNTLDQLVDPPTFEYVPNDGGYSKLVIRYKASQLVSRDGCPKFNESSTHTGYKCSLKVKYLATEVGQPVVIRDDCVVINVPKAGTQNPNSDTDKLKQAGNFLPTNAASSLMVTTATLFAVLLLLLTFL